ncbi:WbqC family protein [Prevotella sp. E9-3]
MTLSFLHRRDTISYPQFGGEFVPDLSIIDMLMFCSKEEIQQILNEYDIL